MDIINRNIQHNFRNKYLKNIGSNNANINTNSGGNGLPYSLDEDNNFVISKKITVLGDIISSNNVVAFSNGAGGGGGGSTTIIDNLLSTATDCALSANQGRVLKGLIDSKISTVSWTDITAKPTTFTPTAHTHTVSNITDLTTTLSNYSLTSHTHTFAAITSKPTTLSGYGITDAANLTNFNSHTSNTTVHITAAERTTWNNKVDKTTFDDLFSVVGTGTTKKIQANYSLYSIGEVSAFGSSGGGGGGGTTIIDNLLSTATDCALSANQGRVLKGLIDSKISTVSWNDITSKPTSFTPAIHTHVVNDITNLSTTLSNYSLTSHTHTFTSLTSKPTTLSGYGITDAATLTNFNSHTNDTTVHITATERTSWNNKLSLSGGTVIGKLTMTTETNKNHSKIESVQNSASSITINAPTPFAGILEALSFKYFETDWQIGSIRGQNQDSQGFGVTYNTNDLRFRITNNTTYNYQNFINTGNITATGEITAYSDKRLKSDIKILKNRGKLKPVTFIKNGKQQIGFVAQDIQKLYPELITVDNSSEKYFSLNYMQLTAVLATQVNELYTIIEQQQQQINNLITKNNGSTPND